MLILKRSGGQRVLITVGEHHIWVTLVKLFGTSACLGFEAPPEAKILREEIIKKEKANVQEQE